MSTRDENEERNENKLDAKKKITSFEEDEEGRKQERRYSDEKMKVNKVRNYFYLQILPTWQSLESTIFTTEKEEKRNIIISKHVTC